MISSDTIRHISRTLGIETIGDLERAAGIDDRYLFWDGILADARRRLRNHDVTARDYYEDGRQTLYSAVLKRHPHLRPASTRRRSA